MADTFDTKYNFNLTKQGITSAW